MLKGNPVLEDTVIFKGRQKHSGSQGCFQIIVWFKSSLRESYLPQSFEALNIRFKIPVQEEFISFKKLKVAEEDLLP